MPPRIFSQILFLLLSVTAVFADDFECTDSNKIGGKEYALTGLNIEMVVERTRDTPPTTMVDAIMFNICKDLVVQNELPKDEQCPEGSRACLTTTNKKPGQSDRVVSVIPIATTATLQPKYQVLSEHDGFSVIMHGASYPSEGTPQIFNLTMLCGSEADEPSFLSYENGVAAVQWSTPAACPKESRGAPEDKGPEDGAPSSGSGIGWFFFLIFAALGAYFAVGAYRNYTNYGASGWDLVSHRDFWRDVPFLLRDLAQHLINAVRGGPSRGGYQAV